MPTDLRIQPGPIAPELTQIANGNNVYVSITGSDETVTATGVRGADATLAAPVAAGDRLAIS